MNKLLRVELSRRLTSIIYIGEIILLLVYNFLEISGSTYGFEVKAKCSVLIVAEAFTGNVPSAGKAPILIGSTALQTAG